MWDIVSGVLCVELNVLGRTGQDKKFMETLLCEYECCDICD